MRFFSMSAACLSVALLAGLATAAEPGSATGAPPAGPGDTKDTVIARVITIDPNAKMPVCRRYVPTGSRIATEVCATPEAALTKAQQADHDLMRRDVQELRMQQTMRDQARAQAQVESLRRRANR